MAQTYARSAAQRFWTPSLSLLLILACSLRTSVLWAHPCLSNDPVNGPACWKSRPDSELKILLEGTSSHPLPFPEVCGEVVETPDEARAILGTAGSSPCDRYKRQALAAIFNIRRSTLLGDDRVGDDVIRCLCVEPFALSLRCGGFFVHDPYSSDPNEAVLVTGEMDLFRIIEYGNQLCAMASCPAPDNSTCGKTIGILADLLDTANNCPSRQGSCGLCPNDHDPPVIHCPSGTLEFECTGPQGAAIQYTVTATDDCDGNPTITCFPPPGTVLPAGTTREVVCTATDNTGHEATCRFNVRIVDTKPPLISCPDGPIVVDCVAGGQGNGAIVNYPDPTASDLCDDHPTLACDPPAGSFFPFGVTTVKCTATDDAGNMSMCSFEVQVVESTPPTLTCPGDITTECTGPDGAVVTYPAPMASTTCDPPIDVVCDPPPGSTFPIGSTVVVCTARTQGGGTLECRFSVTVTDTVPPVIICPSNMLFECSSPDGTPVSYAVSATDTCDPAPDLVCVPPSGSLFPVGVTTVVCTATDHHGNTSSCSFRVTVEDTTPPEISCPQGPVLADCTIFSPGPGAIVNFPPPSVSDACDGSVEVVCTPPSGSVFPLGVTLVKCTATDDAGNMSMCSFEVRVVDNTPPMLVCPGDVVAECTSPEGAVVDFPSPVVADECDGNPLVTCAPPPGSLFPPGPTVVACSAMDASGNTISCQFTVTVRDTRPPQLACPSDKIVECTGPSGTPVDYTVGVSDNCDPAPRLTCDPPPGTLFAVGATVVRCRAVDESGNEGTCMFTVHVVDTTPPRIECPDPIVAECASPNGTAVTYAVTALDACSADVADVKVQCVPESGSLFAGGTTTVTCVATDPSGNQSRCEFTVTVVDTTPPMISCPQDAIVLECEGQLSAAAQYPHSVASDICDPDPTVVCDPPVGTPLGLGLHTIACVATDDSGNEARCEFTVKVVDTAAPALNCPRDITKECEGPDGAAATYDLPTPTDSCDPAPNLACLPPSGSVFPVGMTTVVCTADDAAGNMVQCTFKVNVVDTVPPSIQCPADISAPCTSADGARVSYTVTATDLCDPAPVIDCVPLSGSLFPPGTTKVTCKAVDHAGNSAECSFNVIVRDTTPPRIVCPDDFERACIEAGTALVEYPAPQVSDECDPAPKVVCDPPSGTRLPRGPHVIHCTATDASGNTASCEFTVTIVDRAAPALICPPDQVVECTSPDGTPVTYPLPVATDACDAQPLVTCVPPSGSLFPFGSNEVVCTAKDQDGNSMQCTFIVRVEDRTPPELNCPQELTADCSSADGAVVTFEVAATDKCDPNPRVACVPASGSLFPIGRTTVNCTAEDENGNRSGCSFTVNVVDRTPPELACPPDIAVKGTTAGTNPHKPPGWPPGNNPPANAITAAVVYDKPTASDACQTEEVTVTCDPPIGTRLGFGTHVITCKARDKTGNESTCTFTVTVELGEYAFIRSDANADGHLDIADPIRTVEFLFLGGIPPMCDDSADANDDGRVNITDVVYSLNYVFTGGPAPPPPFPPLCGLDPTDDSLGCRRFLPCE